MNEQTWATDDSQLECLDSLPRMHLFAASMVLFATLAAGLHAAEKGLPQHGAGTRNDPKVEVRTVSEHRKYFALLAQTAYCFEYSGAWVECWIEVEMDGEVTRFGESIGQSLRELQEQPATLGRTLLEPSGHILWVIRREGSKEVWDLATSVRYTDNCSGTFPCKGIVPPQVSGAYRRRGRARSRHTPDADGTIVLYTLEDTPDEKDQSVRSVKLKCRALD